MAWTGMHAGTGQPISDIEHIWQSIRKILTTPIGSRVMRRTFGSILPDLVDAPINPRTRLLVMSATATAIIKWEPRIRIAKINMELGNARLTVDITGTLRDGPSAGESVSLSIPLAN